MSDVTEILNQIEQGDSAAADQLLPLVYGHLKDLAAAKMSAERADHTLSATALVHEAYLRLVGNDPGKPWDNRGHFFAAAAEAMRRILVNHARDRVAIKRGGNWGRVTLDAIGIPGRVNPADLVAIDDMLSTLTARDPRAGEIAKLRIFAGLTVPEIAEVLKMGRRSVDRQWAFARAWLRTHLDGDETRD